MIYCCRKVGSVMWLYVINFGVMKVCSKVERKLVYALLYSSNITVCCVA